MTYATLIQGAGKTDIINNALTGGIETAIYRIKMAFAARIVN